MEKQAVQQWNMLFDGESQPEEEADIYTLSLLSLKKITRESMFQCCQQPLRQSGSKAVSQEGN